jgi:hypothetical protein
MELLHELSNGDSITLSEVRQVLTKKSETVGSLSLPNRLVIHTTRRPIFIVTGTFSEAQSFRSELVSAVNSARIKEEEEKETTQEKDN